MYTRVSFFTSSRGVKKEWKSLGVAWEDDATLQWSLSLTEDVHLEGFVSKLVPSYVRGPQP